MLFLLAFRVTDFFLGALRVLPTTAHTRMRCLLVIVCPLGLCCARTQDLPLFGGKL